MRYRSWRPSDLQTLAEWIEAELLSGEFDEAIRESIESSPYNFEDVICELINAGEFDEAVIERAETLGYKEVD